MICEAKSLGMTPHDVIWNAGKHRLDLEGRGMIMGILNVTPDSFSDGGQFDSLEAALVHAHEMIAEGADIIDVGGESTRPGAAPVGEEEELRRTVPVIEQLRAKWKGLISIDTTKASVAERAVAAGADIVNDISGLRGDERMAQVCRESSVGVVVMHMQGEPRTMQANPRYDDVVEDVRAFFQERFATLTAFGIAPEQLCFDPGIGFGKTLDHNLTLLAELPRLIVNERPLLIGLSRKRFMAKVLGTDSADPAEWSTVALTAATRAKGALIHRVHAVRENRDALRMMEAVLGA